MKPGFCFFLAVAAVLSCRADEVLSSAQVYVAYESVRPGHRLPVAVKITVADGWHTYAKEPGDSGMPPSITFSGVEGLTVSEWRFPPAETFTDSVGTTYGYEHQVVLLSELLIPEWIPEGSPIDLTVSIQWMICRDICVFETSEQMVSVKSEAVPSAPSADWTRLLKESRWNTITEVQQGNTVAGKEP